MDTKLKRSRKLAYATGKILVMTGLFLGLAAYLTGICNGYLKTSFLDSREFQVNASYLVDELYYSVGQNTVAVPGPGEYAEYDGYSSNTRRRLDENADSVVYFAYNQETQEMVTNSSAKTLEEFEQQYLDPDRTEFDLVLAISKDGAKALKMGHEYQDAEWNLRRFLFGYQEDYAPTIQNKDDVSVGFAVRSASALSKYRGYGYGSIYQSYQSHLSGNQMMSILPLVILVLAILWAVLSMFSNYRRWFYHSLGALTAKLWVELKLLAAAGSLVLGAIYLEAAYTYPRYYMDSFHIACVIAVFWWAYLQVCDFVCNGLRVFRNNIFNTLMGLGWRFYRHLNRSMQEYGFQKGMKRKLFLLLKSTGAFLSIFLALAVISFMVNSDGLLLFDLLLGCIFLIVLLGMVILFVRDYLQITQEIGVIMSQVERIREGDMSSQLHFDKNSLFYPLAQNINTLQQGVKTAVEQQIQSERLKVELITNVSHDLKTPLTSIINYIELLKKEHLSPDYANDYIQVLDKKTQRLNLMVRDLFDVAKANSGNIEMDIQQLDLVEHIRQCLAEMDELIESCSNEIRVSLPSQPAYIRADGQKLYRVFENLLTNAIKYSLKNTRIYVLVQQREEKVSLIVKNISSYEMDFTGEEIVQRFVRADRSRSSEGSGLGLAIAKSFVEIQKGTFEVDVDGDLFRVTITFPLYTPPKEQEMTPIETTGQQGNPDLDSVGP